MKKIVFFDIDGTLWDEHLNIPESTVKAIRRLRQNGHYAFICSGRSRSNIKNKKLLAIGFDGIIAACGTSIEFNGENRYEAILTAQQVKKIVLALEKHKIPAVLEGPEYVYVSPDDFLDDPYVMYLREELKDRVADIKTDVNEIVINKLSASLNGADLAAFKEELGKEFDVMEHGQNLIEIMPHGASKATGIEKVCEMLHISRENTYAFGDSVNDIEMLSFVAHGIAMGNGSEAAKGAAEYITAAIDADGIYHGLKHYELI